MRYLFALFFTFSLFTNETDFVTATFEGDPSSRVADCVDAISGNYFISSCDIHVEGKEPIKLYRSYCSSRYQEIETGGWSLFPHIYIFYIAGEGFFAFEPNGTRLMYQHTDNDGEYRVKITKGLTNAGKGPISGKTNPKNNQLIFSESDIKIITGDGTIRYYDKNPRISSTKLYRLRSIRKPTGNCIYYTYDDRSRVIKIHSTSPSDQLYAWIEFDYPRKEKNSFDFFTSDGKSGHYEYFKRPVKYKNSAFTKRINNWYSIGIVETSDKPRECLEYYNNPKGPFVLKNRRYPGGRVSHAVYYNKGNNTLPYDQIHIGKPSDGRLDRIKEIHSPVGESQSLIPTHFFRYKVSEKGKIDKGFTEVIDSLGDKTHFHYDITLRQDRILYFEKEADTFTQDHNYSLSGFEKYYWGQHGSPNECNLTAKTLFTPNRKKIVTKYFSYDRKGNPTKIQLVGNLRGHQKNDDLFEIKYTYYQDNYNNIKEEWSPGKPRKTYTYLPHTSLVTSCITTLSGKIISRNFYKYDHDLNLIQEILDDGSCKDVNDLSNVTTRLVKQITPRKENPALGYPEVVKECYEDNGVLKTLKKTVFTYNNRCQIVQSDHYDANEKLSYTLSFEYDDRGRLIKSSDPIGRLAKFKYDDLNNLTLEKKPEDSFVTLYKYDKVNRLIETIEQGADKQERIHYFFYDSAGNCIKEIDDNDNITEFSRNRFGHLQQKILPEFANHPPQTIKNKTDLQGNILVETDPLGNQTFREYNVRKDPISIVYPDGTEEKKTYTLNGLIETEIDKSGNSTIHSYDSLDRLVEKKLVSPSGKVLSLETFQYNNLHLIESTDPSGIRTTFAYDKAGRKIKEVVHTTSPQITDFTYDSLGRVQKTVLNNSQVFYKEYDYLDRVLVEKELSVSGKLFSHLSYKYDNSGNIIEKCTHKEEGISKEVFKYDSFNRLISQEDPAGNITYTHYNDKFRNKHGRLTLQTITFSPEGSKSILTYNINGTLAKKTIESFMGDTLLEEFYTYNQLGYKIKEEVKFDKKTIIKKWEYDSQGRPLAVTDSNKVTRYKYTPSGFIDEEIKPDGKTIYKKYNFQGLVTEIVSEDIHYEFSYSPAGKLLKALDKNLANSDQSGIDPSKKLPAVSFKDNLLHLTGNIIRTYDDSQNLLSEVSATNLTLKYSYTHENRLESLQLPDQSLVEYTYDEFHIKSITRKGHSHTYDSYNLSHILTQETGKITNTYTFDLQNRFISSKNLYCHYKDFHYSPNGNLTTYCLNEETNSYLYNDLNQLVSENGAFSHSYEFDPIHNRLSIDDNTYSHNEKNELLSTNLNTYEYDSNGNRIAKNKTAYQYDSLNRLTKVETPKKIIHFFYDPLNRLVAKKVLEKAFTLKRHPLPNQSDDIFQQLEAKESVTYFLHNDLIEIGAFSDSRHELRVVGFEKNADIGATTQIEINENLYFPIHDPFGNISGLVDVNGNLADQYRINPFGEEQNYDKCISPWRFQSKRHDEDIDLIFFGMRFYDPEVGSWITPDPKGYQDSHNLYQFLLNNPLLLFDLFGLEVEDQFEIEAGTLVEKQFGPHYGYVTPSFTSCITHVDGIEHDNLSICFINGMGNYPCEARENARHLSDLCGKSKVNLIYAKTEGVDADIISCIAGLVFNCSNECVPLMHEVWDRELERIGPNGTLLMVAHSRGAIYLHHALKTYPAEKKAQFYIVAVANAMYLNDRTCKSIVHYRMKLPYNDMIPYIDCMGAMNAENIVELSAKIGKPMAYHSFSNPVYNEHLAFNFRRAQSNRNFKRKLL